MKKKFFNAKMYQFCQQPLTG
ncbi:MAG TPA: hypothetical protein DCE27_05720, partial [Xanthomarina gelatinilytica]|nr:hypothetical protein [Xanthomarina gelatinilytica]